MNAALAFLLASMAACGPGQDASPVLSPISSPDPQQAAPDCGPGLAAVDLAGVCRASPPTPGALEAIGHASPYTLKRDIACGELPPPDETIDQIKPVAI